MIPPAEPRHDITVALGATSPSRISSQPIIWRPLLLGSFSIRVITMDSADGLRQYGSCRLSIFGSDTCLAFWDTIPTGCGASSPPMWMYLEGNMSMISAMTSSRNCMDFSLPMQHIFEYAPTWAHFIQSQYIPFQDRRFLWHVAGLDFGDDR